MKRSLRRPDGQRGRRLLPGIALPLLLASGCGGRLPEAELAIVGGRVMDPASGTDSTLNVLLRGDRIVAVTDRRPEPGRVDRVIDASGLVVAPGFVDILAELTPSLEPQRYKVKDGVTTVINMHGGPVETDGWYRRFAEAGGALINYGTAVGHDAVRVAAGVTDPYRAATREERREMVRIAARSIEAGALGVGFGINYTPGASYEEVVEMFQVAADHDVPAHVHSRHKGSVFPGTITQSMEEIIAAAAITGAATQMVHIASSAIGSMGEVLRMAEGARAHGIDVMLDLHPYRANSTRLESALYDPGWEERFGGIAVDSIMLLDTGERLAPETFARWRARGATVVTFFIPREETVMALKHPLSMITSDGTIRNGRGHPRGAGTFAKVLGEFVREEGHLTLMEALRKMTVLPASRLERSDPSMRDRGRIRAGALADLTVFDPETIRDRATYEHPARYSEGVRHVIVAGVPVLEEGEFVEGVRPGRAIRRPWQRRRAP